MQRDLMLCVSIKDLRRMSKDQSVNGKGICVRNCGKEVRSCRFGSARVA